MNDRAMNKKQQEGCLESADIGLRNLILLYIKDKIFLTDEEKLLVFDLLKKINSEWTEINIKTEDDDEQPF